MGYNWQQKKMKKTFVIAAMAMFMAGAACNAQNIYKDSKKAERLAKEGKTTEAKNTASKAVQENKWGGSSTSSSSGLYDKVSKAAEKAREDNAKSKASGQSSSSNSNGSSTSDSKSATPSSGNGNSPSSNTGASNSRKK